MDIVTYALLNKKIKGITSGIQSANITGTTITFTMNDGTTQSMTFPTPADGENGISVIDMNIDTNNHLICTMSDNSKIDAGEIPTISKDVEQIINDNLQEALNNNTATDDDIDDLW